ncbi:hypothetical protein [Subtercola endophyticus]|uniref:hypothetical protein n=1 Tax=Subtercola endophyticus TaxID=2895559 RepID=UPI001E3EB662|nr:hypothetical protein [Subtercola endophyticus]UFS58934.1 hypothetical protein LQ955_18385 [Subtercola endophyticus]
MMWIDGNEKRVRAKQLEMLSIDERSAEQWVNAMLELVSRNLGDEEFTKERMARLHAWEKQRKREQHNLHYKYDPRRRNPKLVERDTRRQLEVWRRRLDERSAQLAALTAATSTEPDRPALMPPETPPAPQPRPAARERTPVRSLDGVSAASIAMISADTGIAELEFATDDEIRREYMIGSGLDAETAQLYVDMLNKVAN